MEPPIDSQDQAEKDDKDERIEQQEAERPWDRWLACLQFKIPPMRAARRNCGKLAQVRSAFETMGTTSRPSISIERAIFGSGIVATLIWKVIQSGQVERQLVLALRVLCVTAAKRAQVCRDYTTVPMILHISFAEHLRSENRYVVEPPI